MKIRNSLLALQGHPLVPILSFLVLCVTVWLPRPWDFASGATLFGLVVAWACWTYPELRWPWRKEFWSQNPGKKATVREHAESVARRMQYGMDRDIAEELVSIDEEVARLTDRRRELISLQASRKGLRRRASEG